MTKNLSHYFSIRAARLYLTMAAFIAFSAPTQIDGAVALEGVVKAGQVAYEHYQAYEAARKAVSLEIHGELTITPNDVRVSENPRLRLRDVRVTTTGAFKPTQSTGLTLVTVKIYANNTLIHQQYMRFEGAPTESQWREWYPAADRGGSYPSSYTNRYTEDNASFSFDVVADLEAFNIGQNTIKVELSGKTQIYKNRYNPLNWATFGRFEWMDFTPPEPKQVDLVVRTPYHLSKRPNYDSVSEPHPLAFTQELWLENLASSDLDGGTATYVRPQVTTVGTDGTVPPFAGTSDSEKRLHMTTRQHAGATHGEDVQLPSIDPIRVEKISYSDWQLPTLRGTEFAHENVTLRSTELVCLGTGSFGFVPGGGEILVVDETRVAYYHSRGFKGKVVLFDPTSGPFVPDGAQIQATMIAGDRPEIFFSTEEDGVFTMRGLLAPGEEAALLFEHTDIFGRTFFGATEFMASAQTMEDESGLSLDSPDVLLDLGEVAMELVESETGEGGTRQVELYFFMRGSEDLPLDSLLIEAASPDGEPIAITESLPSGQAFMEVEHGASVVFHVRDFLGRVHDLDLPATPPILRDQTGENALVLYLDPITPTLTVSREGNLIVLEFSNGTLQSTESLGGEWTDEPLASPAEIEPSQQHKFFRVHRSIQ